MEDSRISRRAFLKKFAILSMLSVGGVRCTAEPEYGAPPISEPEYGVPVVISEEPDIMVEYGVEPIVITEEPDLILEYGVMIVEPNQIEQMTYLDGNGTEKVLYGSTIVPINTQFTIYFGMAMDESSQDAVSLSDAGGNAVHFKALWLREQTALQITPGVELQYATQYILEVGAEAKNTLGEAILLTGSSTRAEFTTVES